MLPRLISALFALGLACGAAEALEIRTYTASELGFLASSHLVLGEKEALLVDAQFTRSDTLEVVQMVESSGRRLAAIFVTHARPEHYLGLEVLTESFPDARVLARPATAEAVRDSGEDEIRSWQPIYLDDLPDRLVVPEAFEDETFLLEGVEIRVLDLADEPAPDEPTQAFPTPLYIPAEKTLFASDLALGGVHPWLTGVDLHAWSKSLEELHGLEGLAWVYPGHGGGGGPDLIAESARYLAVLEAAFVTGRDPSDVARAVEQAFPGYRLPVLLERSVRSARER